MPHIHNGPGEYDSTYSAFIVKDNGALPRLMLHHHKILGVFLQFGGHAKLTENPWQAVTREVHEETGYDLSQLDIFQPKIRLKPFGRDINNTRLHPVPVSSLSHDFPGIDHKHSDTAYAFITAEDPRDEIQEGESKAIDYFTLEELQQIEPVNIFENVRAIGTFILTEVYDNFERVKATSF